jgi:hypothetical protein
VPLTTAAAIFCAWRISVLRGRCAISASGDSNDYVVLDGGRVIGRVMLHPQAPEAHPWFWTITAMEHPPSVYNKGYSATREQAMADFKSRWTSH